METDSTDTYNRKVKKIDMIRARSDQLRFMNNNGSQRPTWKDDIWQNVWTWLCHVAALSY